MSELNLRLISGDALLVEIWPDEKERPTLRWLREMQAKRLIPYIKLGHKVYFNPVEVRAHIEKKTIRPRP